MPGLDDDAFMSSPPPVVEAVVPPVEVETPETPEVLDPPQEDVEVPETPEPAPEPEVPVPPTDLPTEPAVPEAGESKEETPPVETPAAATIDYEAAYKQIMAPFKANGRMVELKDPNEVIQLMQMGANFTRKMQALSEHRKIITMLGQHDLLDEGKLSYLIDLDKKNPEAIKKLLRESGTDPLSVDLDTADQYQAGSHRVTDAEVALQSILEDIGSTPEGKDTLRTVSDSWDKSSKEIVWNDPEVLVAIHEQRLSGVYDKISAEAERLITLGVIPPNTPFLQAYHFAGNRLSEMEKTPAEPVKPVATRVVVPKTVPADKAAAASVTRSAAPKSDAALDLMNLGDAEFLKAMKDRV